MSPDLPPDLTACTATELAGLIRSGACSSAEAVEAHLARIERLNPRLNAVVTLAAERALTEAAAADAAFARGEAVGALHGVPITVKDGFATAGLRTTWGLPFSSTRLLTHHVPKQDAAAVAALRRAGAVVLGKTNLPLASYDWQTRHPWLGRTNNPHDPARTPGGSSGGGAAAVAARLAPLDLGSDACGSLRVPAHFCGVLALRPTEGRVPTAGMLPPGHPALPHTLVPGPIARSAADLRLALSALVPSFSSEGKPVRLRGLRVAFSEALGEAAVGSAVGEALRAFVGALERAGCHVEEASPVEHFGAAVETWGRVHGYEFARGFPWPISSPPLHRLAPAVFARRYGVGRWPRALGEGFAERRRLLADFDAFFERYDVWIHPVAGVAAFTHRPTGVDLEVDGRSVPYSLPLGELNTVTALAGTPCVAFPVGTDGAGLPVGLQAHARRGADAVALAFAGALEAEGLTRVPPP